MYGCSANGGAALRNRRLCMLTYGNRRRIDGSRTTRYAMRRISRSPSARILAHCASVSLRALKTNEAQRMVGLRAQRCSLRGKPCASSNTRNCCSRRETRRRESDQGRVSWRVELHDRSATRARVVIKFVSDRLLSLDESHPLQTVPIHTLDEPASDQCENHLQWPPTATINVQRVRRVSVGTKNAGIVPIA